MAKSKKHITAIEIVKRINEQKSRSAAASEAVRRARRAIRDREQFIPVSIYPAIPSNRASF